MNRTPPSLRRSETTNHLVHQQNHFVNTIYYATNHQHTTNGVTVGCANGSTMQSKATDCLDPGNLPIPARTCHKFKEVHLPLVSVPKLCAHGCKVHFGPTAIHITKNEQVLLSGTKDPTHNLCMVPLHDTMTGWPRCPHIVPPATAANAYNLTRTTQQLAFLYASTGYPTRTTFLRAIHCNYFPRWPHLTLLRAARLLQKSVHTANGHIHMKRKHICSSNPPPGDAHTDPPAQRSPAS